MPLLFDDILFKVLKFFKAEKCEKFVNLSFYEILKKYLNEKSMIKMELIELFINENNLDLYLKKDLLIHLEFENIDFDECYKKLRNFRYCFNTALIWLKFDSNINQIFYQKSINFLKKLRPNIRKQLKIQSNDLFKFNDLNLNNLFNNSALNLEKIFLTLNENNSKTIMKNSNYFIGFLHSKPSKQTLYLHINNQFEVYSFLSNLIEELKQVNFLMQSQLNYFN